MSGETVEFTTSFDREVSFQTGLSIETTLSIEIAYGAVLTTEIHLGGITFSCPIN